MKWLRRFIRLYIAGCLSLYAGSFMHMDNAQVYERMLLCQSQENPYEAAAIVLMSSPSNKVCSGAIVGINPESRHALVFTNEHCSGGQRFVRPYLTDTVYTATFINSSARADIAFYLIQLYKEDMDKVRAYPIRPKSAGRAKVGTTGYMFSGFWDGGKNIKITGYDRDGDMRFNRHFAGGDSGSPIFVGKEIIGVHNASTGRTQLAKTNVQIWDVYVDACDSVQTRFKAKVDQCPLFPSLPSPFFGPAEDPEPPELPYVIPPQEVTEPEPEPEVPVVKEEEDNQLLLILTGLLAGAAGAYKLTDDDDD